jgi:hypothetical protein
MKYKICKLVDGNGNVTYQIKKKGWLFWTWIYTVGPSNRYEPLNFLTFEQANNWVEESKKVTQYFKNCRRIKVVECVEV